MFSTKEKTESIVNERSSATEKQAEPVSDKPAAVAATSADKEKTVQPEKIEQPPVISAPAEEKINVAIIISGVKYEAAIKPGSSVYDLMNLLKAENKINFSGKDYASLGFFVEEINGLKNNPAGENWIYYVNGQPAQVGVSYYKLKAGDTIEWRYEVKSF